jgi:hypothetical protein
MSTRNLARRLIGIPWPPLLAVALVATLAVAVVIRRNVRVRSPQTTESLAILVSGDTQGVLFPRGCALGQPGGLARRGEVLRQVAATGKVLYVELGNAPGGESDYDRLKFAAILRGEMAMGLAAHNLGPGEVRLGAEELHRLAAELQAPFVSTNVRDSNGRPLAQPMRLVKAAGRTIAVLGLLSPSYADDSLEILDPAEAIAAALHEATAEYDALLVLAYFPADELLELAGRLPTNAVLVGPSRADRVRDGNLNLAGTVGREGRTLIRIDYPRGGGDWTAREIDVTAALAEDAAQLANLEAYHQELARRDFPPSATGLAMPLPPELASAGRVAGTHACRACHANECASWDRSRHERAWQTLADRGFHFDATCQRCHTTGYGWEGGFQSAERSFGTASVGCESCHGPSLNHVLNPTVVRTPLAASQQCAACHDADASPGFDFAAYWAQIQHGRATTLRSGNLRGTASESASGPAQSVN